MTLNKHKSKDIPITELIENKILLSKEEALNRMLHTKNSRSHNATLERGKNIKYMPYQTDTDRWAF